MKIDANFKVSTVNKLRELIDSMTISDRHATLYMDSKTGAIQQVVALNNNQKRQVISTNTNDRILGVRGGKVYIGEVKNNQLVKIKTTEDLEVVKDNPSLKTQWEGSIPFDKKARVLIGVNGQVVVYDNQTAYIVIGSHLSEVKLLGNENYVSADGAELIQLTREETSTLVELQPLKSY